MGLASFKFHQINSSNKVFNKTFINENSDVIFMPGCSLSGYNEDIILNIYKYLKKHIKNIGISFSCCYKPSIMINDNKSFNKYYKKLDETLKDNNIKEVITACPNCYKTVKNNSGNVKVSFLLDVIKEKGIDESLLNHYKDVDIKFAIHDSCAIRGENSIYESSRYILDSLGVNYVEFEKNKKNSNCCGSIFIDNEKKINQIKRRCLQTNVEYIICYCETCTKSMLIGDKKSIHVLDLMFNKEIINKKCFTQNQQSSIISWNNRYKLSNRRKYE